MEKTKGVGEWQVGSRVGFVGSETARSALQGQFDFCTGMAKKRRTTGHGRPYAQMEEDQVGQQSFKTFTSSMFNN